MKNDLIIATGTSSGLMLGLSSKLGWITSFTIAVAYFSLYLLIARQSS